MKRHLLSGIVLAVCMILVAGTTPALAQSGNTWQCDFFNNTNWEGWPVFTQWVGWISFDWGTGSPSPAVPVDNFSGRFTTSAFFYAGNYTFSAVADDEFVLIVDGITYLDTRGRGMSGKSLSVTIPMWQGNHTVQVLYREFTVTANIWVNWALSGSGTTPPPATNDQNWPPLPASATSVQTQFGDYTPCIQQGIHQSNCFVSDGQWNSPDVGSIAMEPQIGSWVNCSPADTDQTFWVNSQVGAQGYRCSKTLAGWFPR
jgi:hypothetical protein